MTKMEMDSGFIQRVIKTSLVVSVLISLFMLTYLYPDYRRALAFFAGNAWNCLNLRMIQALVGSAVQIGTGSGEDQSTAPARLVLLILVKFPILYGAGLLFAIKGTLPPVMLLAGFTLPFLVIALKALSILMIEKMGLQKDRTGASLNRDFKNGTAENI